MLRARMLRKEGKEGEEGNRIREFQELRTS